MGCTSAPPSSSLQPHTPPGFLTVIHKNRLSHPFLSIRLPFCRQLGQFPKLGESWEIRQSVPISFSSFTELPPVVVIFTDITLNAIYIYKTLVNLSLSENYSFATPWRNFLEMAREIRQNLNSFEVSAQCFREAGMSQVFMLSGLNLKCCWIISTFIECLGPLIDGGKNKMGKEKVCWLMAFIMPKMLCCITSAGKNNLNETHRI